jgi:hypothetical protein
MASAANAEASRIQMLGRPEPAREEAEAIALVAIASLAATAIAVATRGSAHFTAGAAWGLAGIIARNVKERRPRVTRATAAGMAVLFTGLAIGRRRARAH